MTTPNTSMTAISISEENIPVPGTTTSQEVSWYAKELPNVTSGMRDLLEIYSNVPRADIEAHILKFRDLAWYIYPHPSIGQFRFLDLSLSRQSSYASILSAIKEGATLLDIGCCMGQDLRKLIYDGAPTTGLWGVDIEAKFLDLSCDFFLDRDLFGNRLLAADIFQDNSLTALRGTIDIVHVALFLHLWDWGLQLHACINIIGILKAQPGVRVLGQQMATTDPGHIKAGSKTLYKHNDKSFVKLWDEVGVKTGTHWKVTTRLDEGDGVMLGVKKWDTDIPKRLVFEVERL